MGKPWPFRSVPAGRHRLPQAQAGAEALATLRDEVAAELVERLAPVRIQPANILELGGDERLLGRLTRQYPRARITAVTESGGSPGRSLGARLRRRTTRRVVAPFTRLPVGDASVALVVSNLALLSTSDQPALFTECRRVLRPDGAMMFSLLGPDSLGGLRAAWAEIDSHAQLPVFVDMHDVGDAMFHAGLRDPVMDVERASRPVPDIVTLLQLLKAARAGPAPRPSRPGLMTPSALERLAQAYPEHDDSGRPVVTWEVVFGHAWGATTPHAGRGDAKEFHVPVGAIGRRSVQRGTSGLS